MLNRIVIEGNVAFTPEMRRTPTGDEVCTARIACNRDYKDGNGNKKTDWFDIVLWKQKAKYFCDWAHKGSRVIIDGRLQSRYWQDKDGNKRTSIEIVAENVYFGDSKREEPRAPEQEFEELDDDGIIPF